MMLKFNFLIQMATQSGVHVEKLTRNGLCIAAVGFLCLAAGCHDIQVEDDLELLKSRGELVVITRNSTATHHGDPHGPVGFEYELAKAFADDLGVKLRIRHLEHESEMIDALNKGEGDILAAGFPLGNDVSASLDLGPGYLDVAMQVVGRRGGPIVRSQKALEKYTLWLADSSATIESLKKLKADHPGLNWTVLDTYRAEDLLRMVWNRSLPLAIVDSHIMSINHHFFPELTILMTLGPTRQLRWATHANRRRLNQTVHAWFSRKTTRDTINGLIDFYYTHLESLDYVELARYHRRIRTRLPNYRPYFEAAASASHLDWRLVAALAYQESHWNPNAQSYTGVRGIMMLTRETAAHMGIENRIDVETSIIAGTQYLAQLYRQVGEDVREPDRTLMALAAYNIGFGHLQDARILARRLGKPDNRWHGVRSVLPLLQHKKYYNTLENRYARGKETVVYVDRIRTFYKMLQPALDALALLPETEKNLPAEPEF
jgi:membrane-bound lytic murein transglycosylase F